MQLRKLATAMLVMGMTAGLAQAEDAAWRLARTLSTRSPKTALSLSAIVNLRSVLLLR